MATAIEPGLTRDHEPMGSDRSFGLVFAAAFTVIGCWPLIHTAPPRWWALALAALFVTTALVLPQILHPLNRAWLALGRLLHRIMSPLVMGAIFFLCVTPIAYVMRLRGKDVLSLKRRPDLRSYWIPRGPQPSAAETMRRQF